MFYIYKPDMYYKSIYDIDYNELKKKNIKCLVFDLDNTIAPLSLKEPDTKIIEFFKRLEYYGFQLVILSNATKSRVKPFKDILNIDSSYLSWKPHKNKYKKILKIYNLNPEEVACIGDQLIGDIKGANKMGMNSILVDKLSKKERILSTHRIIKEYFIYKYFKKKEILKKGEYYE